MPKKTNGNGRSGNLEQAMALLIQNQASMNQNQTSFLATFLEQTSQADARFARIEAGLDQIKAILLRHERILNELPEAIRKRVGFKSSDKSSDR